MKSKRKNIKARHMDGADLTAEEQQDFTYLVSKLNSETNKKQETVMTMSNFEEDANVGYTILKSQSLPGKVIITKNEDIDIEKKQKAVGLGALNSISDTINKINDTNGAHAKLKVLNQYASLYQLDEFNIEFICKQTGVILTPDSKSLDMLFAQVCESEALLKFFSLQKKTRNEWIKTKKLILHEFLMLSMSQKDNEVLSPKIMKYLLFNEDHKTSPWNEFKGFFTDNKYIKKHSQYLLYSPQEAKTEESKKSKKRILAEAKKEVEEDVEEDATKKIGYIGWGYNQLVKAGKSVANAIGQVAMGQMFGAAYNPTLDGARFRDAVILGESIGDAYGGHYIFLMFYLDNIINTCAKKNQMKTNWKFMIDNDDFVPYDDCDDLREKYRRCNIGHGGGSVGSGGSEGSEGSEGSYKPFTSLPAENRTNENTFSPRPRYADGSNEEKYRRSKKHLKKQLRSGQITRETYKSLKKSVKKNLLYKK